MKLQPLGTHGEGGASGDGGQREEWVLVPRGVHEAGVHVGSQTSFLVFLLFSLHFTLQHLPPWGLPSVSPFPRDQREGWLLPASVPKHLSDQRSTGAPSPALPPATPPLSAAQMLGPRPGPAGLAPPSLMAPTVCPSVRSVFCSRSPPHPGISTWGLPAGATFSKIVQAPALIPRLPFPCRAASSELGAQGNNLLTPLEPSDPGLTQFLPPPSTPFPPPGPVTFSPRGWCCRWVPQKQWPGWGSKAMATGLGVQLACRFSRAPHFHSDVYPSREA